MKIKPYAVVAHKPKADPRAQRRSELAAPKEPWNEAVMADLEQRHASKFFLLISEESCRVMLDTGTVPLGVREQCRHLLDCLDAEPCR